MNYRLLVPSQLAQHLRAIRLSHGLSQAQLGLRLGLSQSRIARMEKSPTSISVDALFQMLEALNVQLVLSASPGANQNPTAQSVAERHSNTPQDDAAGPDDW